MIKIGIVGSRDYTNYDQFRIIVDNFISNNIPTGTMIKIISGGARGCDSLARRYAIENNLQIEEKLPDWNRHGKAAGPIRNTSIVNDSDLLIAFPSHSGSGTQDTIKKANNKGIPVSVYYIDYK